MKRAKIVDIVRFIPERIVKSSETGTDDFFKVPRERHFAYPEYSAADLGARVLQKLIEKTRIDPLEIDAIFYSVAIGDYINIGIGPDIQNRAGANRATVLQMDTGCASFLSMLNAADAFIAAGTYKNIALVTVTNFVSRLDDFQKMPSSWVLGDGASATLVTAGEASILAHVEKSKGEHYGLMICRPRMVPGEPEKHYFDPNAGPLQVEFSETMLDQLKKNALEFVRDAVWEAISKANLNISDIDWLLTHQPNIGLMRKWREAIGILPPKTFDTFHQYGNLFQGSLPVTMSEAIDQKIFKPGDRIALGTFANGGDFVAATILRW